MPAASLIAREGDSVAIALVALAAGSEAHGVVLSEAIAMGHKFALRPHNCGDPVIKLGHAIGTASRDIAAGSHVHSHNLQFARDATHGSESRTHLNTLKTIDANFMGYRRADGRVGTRNYIGVLTSVNCSATVARRVAAHFTAERLAEHPGVDGVAAFTHATGCGMAKAGEGLANLRRTIAGYAAHPNFAGVLVIGLGCEVNDLAGLYLPEHVQRLAIQDAGGTLAAIEAGVAAVNAMLPAANAMARERVSASHLTVGLQCGGSDGYSAITANPALGHAADCVVAAGGRVILSETPEIFGAEDLLLNRAATPDVAAALTERLAWWQSYAARDGETLDNNPSPGNKAGGITTILEKSLGAVAKAGSTPLNAVIGYAEPVSMPGLSFMDSPGYDPCSATGQIASGANLIAFTTGRGSVFGSIPAPTLKLATNGQLARHMAEDIDIDCSPVLEGTSLEHMGAHIFQMILDTASGAATASERLGLGESEFVPWVPGAVY